MSEKVKCAECDFLFLGISSLLAVTLAVPHVLNGIALLTGNRCRGAPRPSPTISIEEAER